VKLAAGPVLPAGTEVEVFRDYGPPGSGGNVLTLAWRKSDTTRFLFTAWRHEVERH
jgi:hypothetical protein